MFFFMSVFSIAFLPPTTPPRFYRGGLFFHLICSFFFTLLLSDPCQVGLGCFCGAQEFWRKEVFDFSFDKYRQNISPLEKSQFSLHPNLKLYALYIETARSVLRNALMPVNESFFSAIFPLFDFKGAFHFFS